MEAFGWLGSMLLAFCALPQALDCYKKGHARGLDHFFLILWSSGELMTLIYLLSMTKIPVPLLLNYIMNIVCLAVIVKFKYAERRKC